MWRTERSPGKGGPSLPVGQSCGSQWNWHRTEGGREKMVGSASISFCHKCRPQDTRAENKWEESLENDRRSTFLHAATAMQLHKSTHFSELLRKRNISFKKFFCPKHDFTLLSSYTLGFPKAPLPATWLLVCPVPG